VGGLVIYSAGALSRFERVEARRSTLLYAAPPILLRSPGWGNIRTKVRCEQRGAGWVSRDAVILIL
jgi:hypothetical protein